MLDKYTFGKTPAAIYLAERLNHFDNKKFNRKVAGRIHGVQVTINQIVESHEAGMVCTTTLNFVMDALDRKVDEISKNLMKGGAEYRDERLPDLTIVNLVCNVLRGEIKSVRRRATKVRRLEQHRDRLVAANRHANRTPIKSRDGTVIAYVVHETVQPRQLNISHVQELITPKELIEKSKARLKRRGLPDKLY